MEELAEFYIVTKMYCASDWPNRHRNPISILGETNQIGSSNELETIEVKYVGDVVSKHDLIIKALLVVLW